jgi:tRNA 2-thiouridine synthesizing protein A
MKVPVFLDLKGLKCPLPALKVRKALARMETEDVLIVEATDPLAELDITHLVQQAGYDMMETARIDHVWRVQIKIV